ncbi:MAG: FtsW/RodA/SpoVE family cell cycle protein [Huintestinicola sp.]
MPSNAGSANARQKSSAKLPKNGKKANAANAKKPLKKKKRSNIHVGEIDVTFLIIVMILLVIGVIMMYSASYAWALNDGFPSDYYFVHQVQMALLGVGIMIIACFFDYHWIKKFTFVVFIGCLVLMLLCFVPALQVKTEDAARWIDLGFIQFQPSELMKLGLIILFAQMISSNSSRMGTIKYGIIPYVIVLGIVGLLLLAQRHVSGLVIICSIGIVLMFVGGVKLKHFLGMCGIVGALGIVGAMVMSKLMDVNYLYTRFEVWLDPFAADSDDAWQIKNSLIAIGSGGAVGMGLGNSRQKFLYLPQSKNDFVFSIVCEELGFVGASVVIILFLLLILRGFTIAANAPDKYGMLLATGITFQIGIQALLNIAVVTNAIPNTGISLPFFSYGGTALVMQLAEMGIVLNISRQSIPDKETENADDASAALPESAE